MTDEQFWGKPISVYTSEQAIEDGYLLDLDLFKYWPINGNFETRPLKYVTTGLLAKGYWNSDRTLNNPNMQDLIAQSLRVFAKMRKGDYFVSGRIELPSGSKQKIFIAQNETGRFTVMLPEDY
jgi:hypothetical protein